jgi:acetyl-CoA carboxylase biotin carboxyl carrier protein
MMAGRNPSRRGESSERAWNLKDIRDLIDLLTEREIAEFEMEKEGMRVRIKRANAHAEPPSPPRPLATSSTAWPPVSLTPPSAHVPASPAPVGEEEESERTESGEELYIIKSPIVGTFYTSPAPNAPPFVSLGDVVQVGQVLCIIEAMKLMNEIESEVAGEIVRIYVENGQPTEYGQSLFAIKPSFKK